MMDSPDLGVKDQVFDLSSTFSITRVVILHGDTMKTLTSQSSFDNQFDNDSFWQGSITWY